MKAPGAEAVSVSLVMVAGAPASPTIVDEKHRKDGGSAAASGSGGIVRPRYRLRFGVAFVVAPRSYDPVSGLPVTERGFGTGARGCNGVESSDCVDGGSGVYGPCDRKTNAACRCPTGPKCRACCSEDWLNHAKTALEDDVPAPEWTCGAHGGVTHPTPAMREQFAAVRERVEAADAANAARSPARPRANDVDTTQSAAVLTFGRSDSPPSAAATAAAGHLTAMRSPLQPTASGLTGSALGGLHGIEALTAGHTVPLPAAAQRKRPTPDGQAVSLAGAVAATSQTAPARAAPAPAKRMAHGEATAAGAKPDGSARDAPDAKTAVHRPGGKSKRRSRRRSRSRSTDTPPRSPSPSTASEFSSPSSSSSSSSDSEPSRSAKSSKRKASKSSRKSVKAKARERSRARRSDDDAAINDSVEGVITNRVGDRVAADRWLRAQREDSEKGAGGGTAFDRARAWCNTTPGAGGLSDVEVRGIAKRSISLYEYLTSSEAKADPTHALRVARRAMLREAMAARCWYSGATDSERKARVVILHRGMSWSKETRKVIEAADLPTTSPTKRKGGGHDNVDGPATATAAAAAGGTVGGARRGAASAPGGAKINA